jgi:isoleucyl-tRNA synthetase
MTTDSKEKKSYKQTLNLPTTAFAMEAKLVQNEPARLKKWQEADLYRQVLHARASAPKWILHDGPPFANGDIHIGHVTNKTLKDVFLRYKTMAGFQTPYVPGWDCHGLPIEHKIQQDLGKQFREMTPLDVRRRCYAYAEQYATVQSEQFQRLGILGNWADPYLTMRAGYEAGSLEVFAKVVENGLVYKQLKTVAWSIANQTALADAELEYKDVEDTSVFVEFAAANPGAFKARFDLRFNARCSVMIWTTTPWTLPANLAIAAGPAIEYAFVKYKRHQDWFITVVAADLVERVFAKRTDVSDREVVKLVPGEQLIGVEYQHPLVERTGKILPADYVTTTDGTGLVHTAPGHGEEDYETGLKHGLEVYCPVQANGRFDSTVPNWLVGLSVWEGNGKIVEKLKELDVLFAEEKYPHSYPHDWRSKTPIIFRATEQWFVALDKPYSIDGDPRRSLRDRALDAVKQVSFIPDWGRARLVGMLESRPDWCISRQRSWGLPIPVFYNEQGEPLLTPQTVRAVSAKFAEHGSDAWFTLSPERLLEGVETGERFPKAQLRKERDIFDVWFESGSSWYSVLRKRPDELAFPADLYLEGSDQHRGWFQLSLLPAIASFGAAPFRQVLTHGFIVKPDGTKVSKSDKEYVTATQEIDRHGADLLRLWVCSMDYQGDLPASPQVLKEFGDKYRKIRNTIRFLLSNLYDYDPSQAPRSPGDVPLRSLDGWALARLDQLVLETRKAYDAWQLHRAFRLIHDFCAVDVSAIYGNAMKDRLYCETPASPIRRRSQYVMHRMAVALVKLLAPMCVFTADEAWEHVPHKDANERDLPSVHLARLPEPSGVTVSDEQKLDWDLLFKLRDDALQQLDRLKKDVGLNKAIDAEVVFHVEDQPTRQRLQAYGVDLADLVGVGFHSFAEDNDPAGAAITVEVLDRREKYAACARSWKRRPDVGSDPRYPDLCARDAAAVKAIATS